MKKENYHILKMISKIILWIAIIAILFSVGYAILNLSSIDNYITLWASIIGISVSFIFISIITDFTMELKEK